MRFVVTGLIFFAGALGACSPGAATEPLDARAVSESSLAERVLAAEAEGNFDRRAQLAEELASAATDDPLAMSLRGYVRERQGWHSVPESIGQRQGKPALQRYEQLRSQQSDTVEGHIQIARWCEQAGLTSQETAHWMHVLKRDPNNPLARAQLGHQQIDGTWVSPEEMRQMQQEVATLRASLAKHGDRLMELYAEMLGDHAGRRKVALERLMAISDADAIPAVAAIFATAPPPLVIQAAEWLGDREAPAAAEILCRWSVDHPDAGVRDACVAELKRRPLYHYVPLLLDRARSPLTSTLVPTFRPDGSLAGVRHVFATERRDRYDVAVMDTVNVRRVNLSDRRSTDSSRRADRSRRGSSQMEEAIEEAIQRRENQIRNQLIEAQVRAAAMFEAARNEQIAALENMSTQVINERIANVMQQTAGTPASATVQELWDWWADYTEREPDPQKRAAYRHQMKLNDIDYYSTNAEARQAVRETLGGAGSRECFVAGTPVITDRGVQPIESVRVGDQVLSKNVQTGELVWDAVILTTEQPAKSLVTVTTDADRMQCTGGHLFWVSGKGWTKARDLQPGDLLHGLSAPAIVRGVASSEAAPTFNLVTARYHNYFVGRGQILSHDFEEPRPTAVRVPGLTLALASANEESGP